MQFLVFVGMNPLMNTSVITEQIKKVLEGGEALCRSSGIFPSSSDKMASLSSY